MGKNTVQTTEMDMQNQDMRNIESSRWLQVGSINSLLIENQKTRGKSPR